MLITEFTTLTGFYPSWALWEVINNAYNESQLDKHEWCRAYIGNKNGMAYTIARLADEEQVKREQALEQAHKKELEDARSEIANLTEQLRKVEAQLDRDAGWHPAKDIGTNMSEQEYQRLAEDTAPMQETYAIKRIASTWGFQEDCIILVDTVETYEVNKYHKCRVSGTYSRQPVWAATDWNYARFNVCGNQWEVVDGELMPYYD